jgi:hypothetical protein
MLLASPAFDKLVRVVGQKDKLLEFREKHGEVRDRVLTAGSALGRLLWKSLREGLHLRFEELRFGKFVDAETLEVDERKMIKAVLDHSNRHDLDRRPSWRTSRRRRARTTIPGTSAAATT